MKSKILESDNEINEKKYLNSICTDASELTQYNEWYIALENALASLDEVYYRLDDEILNLAKDAFNSANNKFNWKTNMSTIENLKNNDTPYSHTF